jgi:transcriptional regulator with XRE-family HTH domain
MGEKEGKVANTHFSEVLVKLMKEKSYSQLSLAKHLGIRQSQISLWIRAKTYPSFESLANLCKMLNVSAEIFF